MSGADWLQLLLYYASVSLLAVGGAIALAPGMHRFLVVDRHWLSDAQFTSSIALAQVAPGPNLLFIAVMGWNVGLNAAAVAGAGRWAFWLPVLGAAICLVGALAPSSLLTWFVTRWVHRNRERRGVRAFRLGMGPVVIGLLLSTSWLLARVQGEPWVAWRPWLITVGTALVVWRTRLNLLWCMGAGALAGALGWL